MFVVPNKKRSVVHGSVFGRLTVSGVPFYMTERNGHTRQFVVCICDCGAYDIAQCSSLINKTKKSCGCLRLDTFVKHGLSKTKLYYVWNAMLHRCYRPRNTHFAHYGARGISVCDEWRFSFTSFFDWSCISGYREGLSIDRIDNNGNYEPSNCRWITMAQQCLNKRDNRLLTAFGETKPVSQWALDERCVVGENTLRGRLRRGFSPEESISRIASKFPRHSSKMLNGGGE